MWTRCVSNNGKAFNRGIWDCNSLRSTAVLCADLLAKSPPPVSRFSNTPSDENPADLERKKLLNKLLYRSKQRGLLEMDLVMGKWAEEEIPKMTTGTLVAFSEVLDEESPDLLKWLTCQSPPPQRMSENEAFQALQHHVESSIKQHSKGGVRTPQGIEWVRGWLDKGNQ